MDIEFGDFMLSRRDRQLRRAGSAVEMSARSFDILVLLLERAGEVVSKDELLETVWPGLVVEENTLQVHVSALRKVLGASAIRTVHGRGYKFAGPDPRSVPQASAGPGTGAGVAKPDARNEQTSIAVLPFRTQSGDEASHLLADGLAEDIITELARYRNLVVTGHRISSQFGERRRDLAEISRELGVDFILDGSVRMSGQAIRVVVELIDTETGAHAWGDRFDCEMTDIFAVQDQIVAAVIGRLAFSLTEAAGRKRERDPTSSSSAYTHFLQARVAWRAGDGPRATQSVERALEIDPDYGRAHGYLAFFLAFSLFGQWNDLADDEIMLRSRAAIDQALIIDRSDPFILQRAAMTLFLLGEPAAALRYAEIAASVSARDSEMLMIHGMILAYCGEHAKGSAMLERAMTLEHQLSPGLYLSLMEVRHLMGDYAGSLAVMEMMPDPPYVVRLYEAAALARLGRTDEARRILDQAPEGFDHARFVRAHVRSCALARDAENWKESFRLAGITV